MKKNNTGITLVALVITIIVLIILAGVSINSVLNGGLIENAKVAKDKFEEGKYEEQGALEALEGYLQEGEMEKVFKEEEITDLKHANGMITGIACGTNVKELQDKLSSDCIILTKDGKTITNPETTAVGTGMQIVKDNKVISTVVIYGDIDGEGVISSGDGTLVSSDRLTNYQKVAADVNVDGYLDCEDGNIILHETVSSGTINQVMVPVDGTNIKNRTDLEWFESKIDKVIQLAGEKFIKLEKVNYEEGIPLIYEIYLSSDVELSVSSLKTTVRGMSFFGIQVLDESLKSVLGGNIDNGYFLKFTDNYPVKSKIKFIFE